MKKAKKQTSTLCFVVAGEFLTDICRSLWADEGDPERAFRIMRVAFPPMTDAAIFEVLTGVKKLVGDSNVGIELVDDGKKTSQCGNSLSLISVLARMRAPVERLKDRLQLATGTTEFVASEKGLVEVPRRRTTRGQGFDRGWVYLKKDVLLKDIPHCERQNVFEIEKALEEPQHEHQQEILEEELEKQQNREWYERNPVEKPSGEIDTHDGWLSPDGKFYACLYGEHISKAASLVYFLDGRRDFNAERTLEETGWVKVATGRLFWDYGNHNVPTQRQYDAVFDWCQKEGRVMPELFEESFNETT